jgi:hypothetical protein
VKGYAETLHGNFAGRRLDVRNEKCRGRRGRRCFQFKVSNETEDVDVEKCDKKTI